MLHLEYVSGALWLQLRHSVLKVEQSVSDHSQAANSHAFYAPMNAKGNQETILCFTVSQCGNFFAVATDAKVVSVFKTSDLSTKLISINCIKRVASLLFDGAQSEPVLYIADKGGDVMRVTMTTADSNAPTTEHVLGHLAMLTAIELIPSGIRCLATADADARIRISRLPNAYNIEAFCLGHTGPVLGLAACQSKDGARLLSLSSDGSLRSWNPIEGVELSTLLLPKPARASQIYCHLAVSQRHGLAACVSIPTENATDCDADKETLVSELLLCKIGPLPQCSLELITPNPIPLGNGIVTAVVACTASHHFLGDDCLLLLGNNSNKPLEARCFNDGSELNLPAWLSVDNLVLADAAVLRREFFIDVLTYASLEASGFQEYLEGKAERIQRLKLKRRRQQTGANKSADDATDAAGDNDIQIDSD